MCNLVNGVIERDITLMVKVNIPEALNYQMGVSKAEKQKPHLQRLRMIRFDYQSFFFFDYKGQTFQVLTFLCFLLVEACAIWNRYARRSQGATAGELIGLLFIYLFFLFFFSNVSVYFLINIMVLRSIWKKGSKKKIV